MAKNDDCLLKKQKKQMKFCTKKKGLAFSGQIFYNKDTTEKIEILPKKGANAMLYSYTLETPAENLCPITAQVQGAVADSGITDGICVVYCPHTTAGITINENADPDVVTDLLLAYRKAFPDRPEFRHMEGNSSAHARASAMGSSVTIPVRNGRLVLGTWQGVYFCEFDGPRRRTFYVSVIVG